MITSKTHQDLKDVLMEPRAKGLKEPYYVIRAEDQNITILSPGKNGIEFNKTHGHFHHTQQVEIFICLYGQGLLLMQRNDPEIEIKEFKVVTLHPGKQVDIPIGYGHALINIGRNFLVTVDNGDEERRNYTKVKEKHGLNYYVVERKGEVAFEQNPNYRVHPQISSE